MKHSSKKEIGKTILVVVAHPDDEVLGCGASIAKWTASGSIVHTLIMAEGSTSRDLVRNKKTKSDELLLLEKSAHSAGNILGTASVKLLDFPDNRMDSLDRLDVIKAIETEIEQIKPDTVVTHHCGDVNIDHRITHEAVVTACRPQPGHSVRLLLAFEVASSTEWQPTASNIAFQPNWFEDISTTLDRKLEALKAYDSEIREFPHSRSYKSVKYLARWRGTSVGVDSAEAFMLLRVKN
jgi:LmbE family N-acetylglucosaminyl deacetylase